ncbi:MAG TPA: VOC family protein [Longimicrobiaceae bacterium]|nr:VOC family protein [Longimicrobiaceae bacterium]
MSEQAKPEVGSIGWADLTVPDADGVRDFYREVVGWTATGLDMGGYEDYCMNLPGSGKTVAGVCHARGANAGLPAQWLVYITVEDVDRCAARVVELGGEVLAGPRGAGGQGRYCVIRDPAGAVCALHSAG